MPLDLIDVGTSANDGTGDPIRTAFQKTNAAITAVNSGDSTFGAQFANNPDTTTDLTYGYNGATIDGRSLSAIGSIDAGTIDLADNNTHYVYYSSDTNSVLSNTTGWPTTASAFPMALVTTASGAITNIDDQRAWAHAPEAFLYFWGIDLARNTGDSSALHYEIYTQPIRTPGGQVAASNGAVTLTDDATNYVEFTITGIASANTSGFTPGNIPCQIVTTVGGEVTNVVDARTFLYAPGPGPQQVLATGGAAGDITATGIKVGDRIDFVQQYTAGALTALLTSEFSVTGTNTINNTGGTNTTGTQLLVGWTKLTE